MSAQRLFISSTRTDLEEYRNEVITLLAENGQIIKVMEGFGSRSADAIEVCRGEIDDCDILVGIYGFRYGFVPPDASVSITEQEFVYALNQGKRCLCYLADEKLALTLPSDGKEHEVGTFKEMVKKLLVVSVFESPLGLAARVAGDVARIISGDPLGISIPQLRKNWESEALHSTGLLITNQSIHVCGWWSSPLAGRFKALWEVLPWHQELLDVLIELKHDLEDIDIKTTYETLREKVRQKLLPRFESNLKALRQRARYDHEEVEKYESTLARLRLLVQHAECKRCLLVVGSVGAGKSHFLMHMLGGDVGVKSGSIFPLHLEIGRYFGGSLEEFLLDSVRRWSKQQWRSIAEVDRFLESQEARLVFMVDDLHDWNDRNINFRDELPTIIASWTAYHSVYWIVTCRYGAYEKIGNDAFWKRYGFRRGGGDADVLLGAWLVLDDLNEAEKTGMRIIERNRQGETEGDLLTLSEGTRTRRTGTVVNNPLFAWTVAELTEIPLSSIATFNYIDFVKNYWELLKTRLRPLLQKVNDCKRLATPLEKDDLDTAICLIARILSQAGVLSMGLDQAMRSLRAAEDYFVTPEEAVPTLVELLTEGNIISLTKARETEKPNPYATPDPKRELRLTNDTFWAYHFSLQLLPGLSGTDQPERYLADSFGSAGIADLREDIIQFFLLELDARGANAATVIPTALRCWKASVENNILPSSAPWLAGPRAGCGTIQSLIGRLACEHPPTGESARDLFAYLYFNGEAVPADSLTYPKRMKNLRYVFPYLIRSDYDLSSYLSYVVRRILRNVEDNSVLVACLHELHGCHTVGVAEEVGKSAFDKVSINAKGDAGKILQVMLRYTDEALGYLDEEYRSVEVKRKGWERTFLREYVLMEFCFTFTEANGAAAYASLVAAGWYGPKRDKRIRKEMEREANIALGEHYRRSRGAGGSKTPNAASTAFILLVEELTSSRSADDRCNAFHLVRHTQRTHGVKGVHVGPEFRHLLVRLFLDMTPDVFGIVDNFYDVFRMSLDEQFPVLEAQRAKLKEEHDTSGGSQKDWKSDRGQKSEPRNANRQGLQRRARKRS